MNRTFRAPRERVFRAWTEAAELDRWFAPSEEFTVKSSVDLRVGGAYNIEMLKNDGQVFGAFGVYREVRPPERLVFTWNSKKGCDGGSVARDTVVTIEFFEAGDSTQVTLTHQNFEDAEIRDRHEQGWKGCLGRLEAIL
jgi:uncharacterized protein YndB with AHSA1/START domain